MAFEREFKAIEKSLSVKKTFASKKFYYAPKRKVKVAIARKNKEENLKKFTINSSELISLNAMSIPMIKTVAVATMLNGFTLPIENPVFDQQIDENKIASTVKTNKTEALVKKDEVSLGMSALEKLDEEEEAMINALVNNVEIDIKTAKNVEEDKDKKKSDEMLFFDYSEKEEEKLVKTVVKEMKKDLPNVISMIQQTQNEIKEEIRKDEESKKVNLPKGKQVQLPTQIEPVRKEVSSPVRQPEVDYSKKNDDVKSLMSSQKKNDYPRNAKLTIKTSVGIIGKSLKANTSQFQFISDVSFGEPVTSGSIGAIEIEEMINEKVSTIRGTILGSETFPTIVELPLEYGDYLMNIPLLDRDNLFKKYEGIRGALLLVELDESTDSIDIDHKYVERVYLSENFKEVDEGDSYRFILFVGVEPGNTLIQYLTLNEEVGEKIVHLVEDHVFYESNTFIESEKEKIELYETKVLGKKDLELNIEGEDIAFFNSGIKSKSIGLNLYEIDTPIMPLGMRKYLELSHLVETIYAGYQDNKSIKVPSKEYLNYVMDTFEIDSIENQCMLQINFEKPIVDFSYASESYKGPIAFEVLYLDKDGMFNEDASDFAKKVFLVGDTPGSINLKVEYADNSKDYFQTFCSPNTFVVEQL
jgi:vacuolar-type H+-ATPase subunit F/Vma7